MIACGYPSLSLDIHFLFMQACVLKVWDEFGLDLVPVCDDF